MSQTVINDPIHGSMPFEGIELELIGAKAFQRLKNIRQLGMTHHVYPSAAYDRYTHSLGVCHLAKRFLKEGGIKLSVDDEKHLTVAALLHDIGHYPFSHSYEQGIRQFNDSKEFEIESLDHEDVSRLVITRDPEIKDILGRHDIDTRRIVSLIRHTEPNALLAGLISSDLDADRSDYLCRTAHMAGLRYGYVDLDYLTRQSQVHQKQFVFDSRAVSAIDHFLVGRFLEYGAVALHKNVASFEVALCDVLANAMALKLIPNSGAEIERRIELPDAPQGWHYFDDSHVLSIIEENSDKLSEENRVKLEVLKWRSKPLHLDGGFLITRTQLQDRSQFEMIFDRVKDKVMDTAGESRTAILLWKHDEVRVCRHSSSQLKDLEAEDVQPTKVVHIKHDDGHCVPIVDADNSLMKMLGNVQYYGIRSFLLPGWKLCDMKKEEIRVAFNEARSELLTAT